MNLNKKNNPKVSIGLPVYNGEKFIHKRIESILSQTLHNFELIISDNASTDKTSLICKEFASKDNRIRYFRQERNMGMVWNFNFVLDKAKCDYFVWAGVDDVWLPEFLEENIKVLENDKRVVGSVSKIKYFGKKFYSEPDKFLKKMKCVSYDDCPKPASYEDRVRFYLFFRSENIYGVYRVKELKKSWIHRPMGGMDKAIILSILKYGEINIIDKVLMGRSSQGFSGSASLMERLQEFNGYGLIGRIFPFLPFTFWCVKELGIKIFCKNLEYFIRINYGREKFLLRHLIHSIKNKTPKFTD